MGEAREIFWGSRVESARKSRTSFAASSAFVSQLCLLVNFVSDTTSTGKPGNLRAGHADGSTQKFSACYNVSIFSNLLNAEAFLQSLLLCSEPRSRLAAQKKRRLRCESVEHFRAQRSPGPGPLSNSATLLSAFLQLERTLTRTRYALRLRFCGVPV